jgi:hypothetical protein
MSFVVTGEGYVSDIHDSNFFNRIFLQACLRLSFALSRREQFRTIQWLPNADKRFSFTDTELTRNYVVVLTTILPCSEFRLMIPSRKWGEKKKHGNGNRNFHWNWKCTSLLQQCCAVLQPEHKLILWHYKHYEAQDGHGTGTSLISPSSLRKEESLWHSFFFYEKLVSMTHERPTRLHLQAQLSPSHIHPMGLRPWMPTLLC